MFLVNEIGFEYIFIALKGKFSALEKVLGRFKMAALIHNNRKIKYTCLSFQIDSSRQLNTDILY